MSTVIAKRTSKKVAPIVAEPADWRTLFMATRQKVCAILHAAHERLIEDEHADSACRLSRLAIGILTDTKDDSDMADVDEALFNALALVRAAREMAGEVGDDDSVNLLDLSFEIIETSLPVICSNPTPEELAAVQSALASPVSIPSEKPPATALHHASNVDTALFALACSDGSDLNWAAAHLAHYAHVEIVAGNVQEASNLYAGALAVCEAQIEHGDDDTFFYSASALIERAKQHVDALLELTE